ncbi:MAG: glycoside hydrolase family 2 protein [Solimonas sp.]
MSNFITTNPAIQLDQHWEMTSTAAAAIESPAALSSIQYWIPAMVPGTVAQAMQAAGTWQIESPHPLHDSDHWYRARFAGAGKQMLRFNGLATLAEVWLNGEVILRSSNMFIAHEVEVDLRGDNELCICFRALDGVLKQPLKRARWRPAMIVPATLRGVRTTLLGNMPGWCPEVHAVGPWRGVDLIAMDQLRVVKVDLRATLEGNDTGRLQIRLQLSGTSSASVQLECAGSIVTLKPESDELTGSLTVEHITPWWPHTHGVPQLYPVAIKIGNQCIDLGRVGFRRIEVDHGADGNSFTLKINGVRVFCRGACWTNAGIAGLSGDREAYLPWLQLMKDANMNMVRIGGTMLYESNAFYALCDELGIMVWQDFMFANFDYPVADENFAASVRQEVQQFLNRTQSSPCITVLCGGSEVSQQAAMLGFAAETWTGPLFDVLLPDACSALRPDVPYVKNSPYGGELPFIANSGVTHYYGVGAYMRPLEDVRRTEVKFASECLAFSNVPESITLNHSLPVPALHHPLWKQRVPRDMNASWDFEDVREFYLGYLFKVDPMMLRRTDPERYLELSRAVTGEVMEQVFAEWRRRRSPCAGGLVWTYQDLMPGAGWGVVDSTGEPKATWYALRRAFRPVQVAMTDEGVNGIAIHVINDGAQLQNVTLSFMCMRDASVLMNAERSLQLLPHSAEEISANELLGRFFDVNYSYRFGPPAHDVNVAVLKNSTSGEVLATAFHLPQGYDLQPRDVQLQVSAVNEDGNWYLHVKSSQFAMFVHVTDENYRAEDNWFHLAANMERRIRLIPRSDGTHRPDGEVRVVNGLIVVRYRV